LNHRNRPGDSQWQFIQELLPLQRTRQHDLRVVMNAILWLVRTGAQWRNLDSRYPKWQSVYYHFYRWSHNGTIDRLNRALNCLVRLEAGRAALPGLMGVNSQCGLMGVNSQCVKLAPYY
jgi:transposase